MVKIPWRQAQQPTPVFLPGGSHDRGAWQAMVHGVAKSRTQLSTLADHLGRSLRLFQSSSFKSRKEGGGPRRGQGRRGWDKGISLEQAEWAKGSLIPKGRGMWLNRVSPPRPLTPPDLGEQKAELRDNLLPSHECGQVTSGLRVEAQMEARSQWGRRLRQRFSSCQPTTGGQVTSKLPFSHL